ncbi:hypothetical protein MKX03_030820 [Papaver bracteatum]|nr:hypothetical protein MKX03_030820 [Papaver bracteatum]
MDFKDLKDPIRHLSKGKVEDPSTVTKVFIEVQIATKRVYRTKSGLLLNHLHGSSPSKAGPINKFLSSWRLFQIDFDDLLAKDVFYRCDSNSLLSMYICKSDHSAARFVNFFKRRVPSYCKKIAPSLIETKRKVEAEHSLGVCGKSCILREESPYGATLLPKGAFLFSAVHGSMVFTDDLHHFRGQTCAVCMNAFSKGSDILRLHCKHAFHSRCLIPWFNKVGSCPVCRYVMRAYTTRRIPPHLAHLACRLQTF